MAFNVRIFGYRGISQIRQVLPQQYTADSVFLLDEPFIFGQTISVSAAAAISTANTDASVRVLRVEVPPLQAVRYRIIPAGQTVVDANTDCPYLTGLNNFGFAPSWKISLIDAAGLP